MPDYVIETSWEVCNKVGGIYTVLSTRAAVMCQTLSDHVIFIGPDIWGADGGPYFEEDHDVLTSWLPIAQHDGLQVRAGRWNVPGRPQVVLVKFSPDSPSRNEIYGQMWADYGVDSLHAYGDYDEASMFAWMAG